MELILRDVPWAKVTPVHCDLASQASIRTFVTEFIAMGHPLHLLINNAGIYMPGPYRETQDGFEQTLGVNYFGHCYLTLLLQVGGWGWLRCAWEMHSMHGSHVQPWPAAATNPVRLTGGA